MTTIAQHGRGAVVTIETAADKDGKQRFVIDWVDEYGRRRGQYFYADTAAHISQFTDLGYRVSVLTQWTDPNGRR